MDKTQIRLSLLRRRRSLLNELRGAAFVDLHGDELFDVFDAKEINVIKEALFKHYQEEIENLKRLERTAAMV